MRLHGLVIVIAIAAAALVPLSSVQAQSYPTPTLELAYTNQMYMPIPPQYDELDPLHPGPNFPYTFNVRVLWDQFKFSFYCINDLEINITWTQPGEGPNWRWSMFWYPYPNTQQSPVITPNSRNEHMWFTTESKPSVQMGSWIWAGSSFFPESLKGSFVTYQANMNICIPGQPPVQLMSNQLLFRIVPEPASILALAAGFASILGVGVGSRRRKTGGKDA